MRTVRVVGDPIRWIERNPGDQGELVERGDGVESRSRTVMTLAGHTRSLWWSCADALVAELMRPPFHVKPPL